MQKLWTTVLLCGALAFGSLGSGSAPVTLPAGDSSPAAVKDTSAQPLSYESYEVVALVNEAREDAGLEPLARDKTLEALAQERAEDMAQHGYFSHVSPTYGTVLDRMQAQGYRYKIAGENIAKGQRSALLVTESWMGSQGHRENILQGEYTRTGVGYATAPDGTPYWVQVFAG